MADASTDLAAAVNPQTGSHEAVSTAEATARALEDPRTMVTQKNGNVVLRTAAGKHVEVPPAEAATLLATGRFEISTPTQLQSQRVQERSGGIGTAVFQTLPEAYYRGLTFGASDALARALAPSYASGMAERVEASPVVAGVGQMHGMLGGAALTAVPTGGTGTAAALARVGAAPTRAMMGAGSLAARGAGAVLGRGAESLAGRALVGAARGAAEGGVLGIGSAVSDAALHDRALTAELLVHHLGPTAILGGIIGGGTPLVGAALRSGKSALSRALVGESSAASEASAAAPDVLGAGGAKPQMGKLNAKLDKIAGDLEVKATGGTQRQQDMILKLREDNPEAWKHVRSILGDITSAGVDKAGQKEIIERIAAEKTGQIGRILREVEGTSGPSVDAREIAKQLMAKVDEKFAGFSQKEGRAALMSYVRGIKETHLTPFKTSLDDLTSSMQAAAKSGNAEEATRIGSQIKQMQDVGPRMSLEELNIAKAEAHRASKYNTQTQGYGSPNVQGHKLAGAHMNEAVEQKVAELGGPEALAKFKDAKHQYAAISTIREAIGRGAASEQSVRSIGVSEQAGAIQGLVAGGMAGGPIGSVLGGIGSAVAHHILRKRGAQMGANAIRAFVEGEGVAGAASAAARSVNSEVKDYITHMTGKTFAKDAIAVPRTVTSSDAVAAQTRKHMIDAGVPGSAELPALAKALGRGLRAATISSALNAKQVSALAEHIHEVMTVPAHLDAMLDRMGITDDADDHAIPGLRDATRAHMQQVYTYLASVAPSIAQPTGIGKRKPFPLSHPEAEGLRTAMHVMEDPSSVIRSLKDRTLVPAQVSALKALAPTVYQQVVTSLGTELADADLSYADALNIGTMFGLPTDSTLSPDYIAAAQNAMRSMPQKQNAPVQRAAPKSTISLASRVQQIQKG